MDIEEIEVTINKNGQVILHVKGAKGETCLELTDDLEKTLGNLVLERKMTAEFTISDKPQKVTHPGNIRAHRK